MILTLTTDFSDSGGFVAQLKAELIKLFGEGINIIDITHNITPFNTIEAAYITATALDKFPEDSMHIVVVDPGVGTQRNIVAVKYKGQIIVSPENEALSLIEPDEIRVIEKEEVNPKSSKTFEARDIMVRAAYLIHKNGFENIGKKKETLCCSLKPEIKKRKVVGKIVYIDNFGNCISNIKEEHLKGGFDKIILKNLIFRHLEDTYHSPTSSYKALINSSGYLEFAYFKKSFADEFGIGYLDEIEVYLTEE
ncbi:SAM hydrolase/SAM-dependent halogenase family protein [Hippea alviniae]|uniref:SAM hydrolase/SAM-dependent halogenase family protein n=1 Tax=Hippea alviniae TaxID=1279027 RepID=UPI0003B5E74A|nr:SAM-dependent chlorinase/fluorinase [Hippea alviniae]